MALQFSDCRAPSSECGKTRRLLIFMYANTAEAIHEPAKVGFIFHSCQFMGSHAEQTAGASGPHSLSSVVDRLGRPATSALQIAASASFSQCSRENTRNIIKDNYAFRSESRRVSRNLKSASHQSSLCMWT
jgi:hypothetical protein